MIDVLFSNACIVTMDDSRPVIEHGFCSIDGKRISYIGNTPPTEEANRIIDCTEKILMPGLINAHSHIGMTLLRGMEDSCTLSDWLFKHIFPTEAKIDKRSMLAGFSLGVAEMLSSGTTSVNDMYFYECDLAQTAARIGFRGEFSNGIISLSPSYDFEKDRSITEIIDIMTLSDLPSDLVRPQLSIHSERTSNSLVWKKAVAFAKDNDLTMHIHLSETKSDHDNCVNETGKTPAARLCEYGVFDIPTIAAHCCYVTEADMDILANHNVTAVHVPVSNLKLASGIADIVLLSKHGVNVALGTDGCSSNDSLDMFEEMKYAALLAKYKQGDPAAFSSYDALKLATVNGAKAQGLQGITGQIIEGFEADITVLDASLPHARPMRDVLRNIVYSMRGSDVYMTMIQGRILYENGHYTTIDINNVYDELNNYALPHLSK